MSDQRSEPRMSCFLRAEVFTAGDDSVIPCEVHDISEHGMKVTGTDLGLLPNEFRIRVPRRAIFERVRVVRRSPSDLGVVYTGLRGA